MGVHVGHADGPDVTNELEFAASVHLFDCFFDQSPAHLLDKLIDFTHMDLTVEKIHGNVSSSEENRAATEEVLRRAKSMLVRRKANSCFAMPLCPYFFGTTIIVGVSEFGQLSNGAF